MLSVYNSRMFTCLEIRWFPFGCLDAEEMMGKKIVRFESQILCITKDVTTTLLSLLPHKIWHLVFFFFAVTKSRIEPWTTSLTKEERKPHKGHLLILIGPISIHNIWFSLPQRGNGSPYPNMYTHIFIFIYIYIYI